MIKCKNTKKWYHFINPTAFNIRDGIRYVKHETRATLTSPAPTIGESGSLDAAPVFVLAGAVAVAVLTINGIIGDPAAAHRLPYCCRAAESSETS